MATIYHITTEGVWRRAQLLGRYEAESLRKQGFVHCSEANQVIRVANNVFDGTPGLVLLHIETERLHSRLVYENLEGGEELFPHIYGPIDLDAVCRVSAFEPGPDGNFDHHADTLGSTGPKKPVLSNTKASATVGTPGRMGMDRRWEVAKSVQVLFENLPEVVSVFLKGSLQGGYYDELSDIDIVIDVSGSNDADFVKAIDSRMESAFDIYFFDWAPSLLPAKFVKTFYLRGLSIFCNLDIEVTATPHYGTLLRSDIVREPTAAHLKLWALNTKYYLRGKLGVDGEIAKLYRRVLAEPAPTTYSVDRLLLEIINYLKDKSHERYQDFIEECRRTYVQYFTS